MRMDTDDEKIRIGDNRKAWSARQLQRMLGGEPSRSRDPMVQDTASLPGPAHSH